MMILKCSNCGKEIYRTFKVKFREGAKLEIVCECGKVNKKEVGNINKEEL